MVPSRKWAISLDPWPLVIETSQVLPRFQQLFPELREMDMLACGHPLYWCKLLANFGVPLLGIWDMSHQLWVPEELQDQWTEEFLELFHRKENVLLTMSAHNSFQVRWLLGLKVPYFQPITPDVSLQARYSPEVRPQEVFVSRFNTPYDVELLRRFAQEAAPLPFRFVSWEEMPCGKHCSKAQLAQFRASVLCAYDTGPLKLAEFYAMAIPIFIFSGGLWRTTMRWARADAKPAGPVAFSLGRDFRDPHPKNFQWLERALRNETESLHWEDPWNPQLTPDLYQGPALCRLALFALFPGSRRAHNAGSRILGATHWLGTAAAPLALRKCATIVADAAGLLTGSATWILPRFLCGVPPTTGNQLIGINMNHPPCGGFFNQGYTRSADRWSATTPSSWLPRPTFGVHWWWAWWKMGMPRSGKVEVPQGIRFFFWTFRYGSKWDQAAKIINCRKKGGST